MALGFDCPNCEETTVIDTDDPDEVKNKIYKCEGCGENVLMEGYAGGEK